MEDYEALRKAAVFVDLTGRGKLEVSGADRVTFLQGMVTNDVKGLAVGRGVYAALLTRTGKIAADMNVYREADRYWIDLDREVLGTVAAMLEKHVITEDVRISDASGSHRAIAILGPLAAGIASVVVGEELVSLAALEHRAAAAGDIPVRVVRTAVLPGLASFELWSTEPAHDALRAAVLEQGAARGLKPIGPEALEAARIEAGIPKLGAELGPEVNPAEAGILSAVSMTKGCYLGQEVVSKSIRVGHAGRKLVGLEIDGAEVPAPGAAVLAGGETAGKITSAVLSPSLGRPIALAYVGQSAAALGTALEVRLASGASVAARVAALPFVAPAKEGSEA